MRAALPDARIGRLGDSGKDDPDDLRRARRDPPLGGGLQAGPARRRAAGCSSPTSVTASAAGCCAGRCSPQYEERLGLTATLERSDDAVTELLLPFFGGICYRYGFEQAIADGVCARPRVAFVGVPLSDDERAEYVAIEQRLVSARQHLRSVRDMPLEPFGDFLAAVAHLAERDAGADGRAARDYLDAFSKRRQIVAQSTGKYELLGSLAPAIKDADGALVFTETVRAANHAINRLDPLVSIDLITGSTARGQRREILDDLRVRTLDAVAAPRVLDEGIDVPDANLGVVMSASRTRRQMIQRMGRILRRKRSRRRRALRDHVRQGHAGGSRATASNATASSTRSSASPKATGVFDSARLRRARRVPRRAGPGGRSRTRARRARAWCRRPERRRRGRVRAAGLHEPSRHGRRADRGTRSDSSRNCRSRPTPHRGISSSSSRTSRPSPSRRSRPSGCRPVRWRSRSRASATAWRISCTGCGEASPLVQFRWQVLDQTVALPLRLMRGRRPRGAATGATVLSAMLAAVAAGACSSHSSDSASRDGPSTTTAPAVSVPAPVPGAPVIIDTDLSRWWDDATALGLANVLQQQGAVNVLGIVSDVRNPVAVAAIDAIDTAYGHADIPLGAVAHSDADTAPHGYSDVLARRLPHAVRNSDAVPEAVALYRRLLARQPDHSVTIVSLGAYTNLAGLIASPRGRSLVTEKVKRLVIMDGLFPGGVGAVTNQKLDLAAARAVVAGRTGAPPWPTPIAWVDGLDGIATKVGDTLCTRAPADNPMRIVYADLFKCGPVGDGDWDAPALLFAVADTPRAFSVLGRGGAAVINAQGGLSWQVTSPRRHDVYVHVENQQLLNQRIERLLPLGGNGP